MSKKAQMTQQEVIYLVLFVVLLIILLVGVKMIYDKYKETPKEFNACERTYMGKTGVCVSKQSDCSDPEDLWLGNHSGCSEKAKTENTDKYFCCMKKSPQE